MSGRQRNGVHVGLGAFAVRPTGRAQARRFCEWQRPAQDPVTRFCRLLLRQPQPGLDTLGHQSGDTLRCASVLHE